ncbi:MAG: ATP-dependent Clp protease ATP-binding subunit ClpA, partial [Pseudomonadales bacterium]
IMTTNAGAQEMSRSSMGFTQQDHSTDGMEIIKKIFTPEFRNRLDAIIQFDSLDREVIKTVVDKFLVEIQVQLDAKKVQLDIDDEARDWLAENGYDEKMGARPMQRLIQNRIKKELAEDILFGKLSQGGGTVHVTVKDGDLALEIDEREKTTA